MNESSSIKSIEFKLFSLFWQIAKQEVYFFLILHVIPARLYRATKANLCRIIFHYISIKICETKKKTERNHKQLNFAFSN